MNIREERKQESIRVRMERKFQHIIPKEILEDIKDMDHLKRIIKGFPDQLYIDLGLDRSKLELRQLKDCGTYTYLGEW